MPISFPPDRGSQHAREIGRHVATMGYALVILGGTIACDQSVTTPNQEPVRANVEAATASALPFMPFEGRCDGTSDPAVTCDPGTGLEWLDLPLTDGRTVAEMRAALPTTFVGWRYATNAEVLQLAFDAGIVLMYSNPPYPEGGSIDPIPQLTALVNTPGAWGAGAFTGDSVWGTGTHSIGVIQTTVGAYISNTDPRVQTVHWLVRRPSAPAALPTLGSAPATATYPAEITVSGTWQPNARCIVTAHGGPVAFLSTNSAGAFSGTVSSAQLGIGSTELAATCAGAGASATSSQVGITVAPPNPVLEVASTSVSLPNPVQVWVEWFTWAPCEVRSGTTVVSTVYSQQGYFESVTLAEGTYSLTAVCTTGSGEVTSAPVVVQVRAPIATAPAPGGTDVSVQPVDPVTGQPSGVVLEFDNITTGGEATVTTSTLGNGSGSPPPPAGGFKLGNPPTYYEIETTAVIAAGSTITVCVSYAGATYGKESNLKLLHYNRSTMKWEDITAPNTPNAPNPNTQTKTICGVTKSLSPFIAAELSYDFAGFFQPVDNLPTVNSVKAGSAVPVRFALGGNMGLDIFAAGAPNVSPYACENTPTDAIEEVSPASTSGLSFSAGTNQYTYVWKTDKLWAGSCRQLAVRLRDGSTHVANFKFTK